MTKQKQLLILLIAIIAMIAVWALFFRTYEKMPASPEMQPIAETEEINNALKTTVTVVEPSDVTN